MCSSKQKFSSLFDSKSLVSEKLFMFATNTTEQHPTKYYKNLYKTTTNSAEINKNKKCPV